MANYFNSRRPQDPRFFFSPIINCNGLQCFFSYYFSGKTHYKRAFQKAFSLLKASIAADTTAKPKKRVILFLTDGAPSEDEERRPIFQTIRDMNLQLNNSVIILTFGFGSVDQNTREILQDIAAQNTARYNVSVNSSVGDITVHI